MVKKCLLILRKTSLTNVSSAFLSDDDFVKDEALITSSSKVEKAEKVEIAEAAKV